jgi:ABC-type molybdate transport system substrate-binding protein
MGKRILGFLFVIILFVTMVYGHLTNHYSVTDTGKAISSEQVILWYSDAGMSDYINSISLTYEKESGVKVIPVLVSAVEMLDSIQNASVHEDNGPDI